jgi:hypothetical protein
MRQVNIFFICIVFFIGTSCALDDSNNASTVVDQLVGKWSSTRITYPNDPIFKDTPPDTMPGKAELRLEQNSRFFFHWEGTKDSGEFQIKGKNLVLKNEDGEITEAQFILDENRLTIVMNDGFHFDFDKIP